MHPHEGIEVRDPLNDGPAQGKSFERALRDVTAYKGHDDDRVTLTTKHGYSATKTRGEWRDVNPNGSMSSWHDMTNPPAESEAAKKSVKPSATVGGETETANFFKAPAEQKKLFSWDSK